MQFGQRTLVIELVKNGKIIVSIVLVITLIALLYLFFSMIYWIVLIFL